MITIAMGISVQELKIDLEMVKIFLHARRGFTV